MIIFITENSLGLVYFYKAHTCKIMFFLVYFALTYHKNDILDLIAMNKYN